MQAAEQPYQCPGEIAPIDRSVHLGRLRSFYPACRNCPHASDSAWQSSDQKKEWESILKYRGRDSYFLPDAFAGLAFQEITPAVIRRFAAAYGRFLRGSQLNRAERPMVVLANDGRPLAAEFVWALCEGLRYGGLSVIDLGFATAPEVVLAVQRWQADGGIFLGNPLDQTRTLGIKCFSSHGNPIDSPGSLDELHREFDSHVGRLSRSTGPYERRSIREEYLRPFFDSFHALRPLRFVLRTNSSLVRQYLDLLLSRVACTYVLDNPERDQAGPPVHFGISIHSDGDHWTVFDQNRRAMDAAALMETLSKHGDLTRDKRDFAPLGLQRHALGCLTLLLGLLSQGDHQLSEIVSESAYSAA